jgi:mortality factor 4-like protein 1
LTPENQQKQDELRSQLQMNKKVAPQPAPKIADPSAQKKRRRESLVEKEVDFLRKPEVKISIPEVLKSQLVVDWEQVTKNQKVSEFDAAYLSSC